MQGPNNIPITAIARNAKFNFANCKSMENASIIIEIAMNNAVMTKLRSLVNSFADSAKQEKMPFMKKYLLEFVLCANKELS